MYHPFLRLLWFLCPFVVLASCSKLLDASATGNQATAATVFDNDADAQTAFAGLYTQMMNNNRGLFNGSITVDAGLSSDELVRTSSYPYEDSFYHNQLTPTNILANNLYATAYQLIYTINSALQGIAASTGMSDTVKMQLRGEAEFNRALVYFYLVNLYGAVPLVTTTVYTTSAVQPRTAVTEVYQQIQTDLADAQKVLPAGYVMTGSNPGARIRPNQAAATALMSRAYLYQGLWPQAEQAASTLIDDGRFSLPGLDSVFLASSPEAIWQLQPMHGSMATAEGSAFLPVLSGRPPAYQLTPFLLNSFETGDLRLVQWTDSVVVAGQLYRYPYKYKLAMQNPAQPEYETVLRLGEQYLIRAEARAQQGKLVPAEEDLNLIRQRAGLPGVIVTDADSLITLIQHERQVELMTEWGHRWLDLARAGLANDILGVEKSAWWKTTAILYPLPAQDLQANPNLTQNPGYNN